MPAGSAVSAGLGLAGGLLSGGSGKLQALPAAKSGYASLEDIAPFRREKFISEELPQALIDYYRSPRVSRPFRRISFQDVENPVFAPRGLMELQRMYDQQAAESATDPASSDAKQAGAVDAETQDMINAIYARDLLRRAVGDSPKAMNTNVGRALSSNDEATLAALGAKFREGGAMPNESGSMRGGFRFSKPDYDPTELYSILQRLSGSRG